MFLRQIAIGGVLAVAAAASALVSRQNINPGPVSGDTCMSKRELLMPLSRCLWGQCAAERAPSLPNLSRVTP